MAAFSAWCRRQPWFNVLPGAILLATLAVLPALGNDAKFPGGPLKVRLDQATIIKLPDRTSTIVIGNPLVADVSVQSGGTLVVTGKGYGATNLLALDRAGSVLVERIITVEAPTDNVMVVYRGIDRETYSCTPKCERRIMLGDTATYFTTTLAQTGSLNAQAQNQATTAPGAPPQR